MIPTHKCFLFSHPRPLHGDDHKSFDLQAQYKLGLVALESMRKRNIFYGYRTHLIIDMEDWHATNL